MVGNMLVVRGIDEQDTPVGQGKQHGLHEKQRGIAPALARNEAEDDEVDDGRG